MVLQKEWAEGEEEEEKDEALSLPLPRTGTGTVKQARRFTPSEWAVFDSMVKTQLPPAARPVFVRFISEIGKTETFKQKKAPLKTAGFDPAQCEGEGGGPVYLVSQPKKSSSSSLASFDSGAPRRVDQTLLDELRAGTVQL